MGINSKTKIILVVVGFVLFAIFMFWIGYGIIGNKNRAIADSIAKRHVELEVLQREQKSFEQGKIDLAELSKSAFPPNELFSSDTKVVKEIQMLEDIAHKNNLEMTLAVTDAGDKAAKAPGTNSDLYVIPYNVTLTGTFSDALMFLQSFEKLPFITHAQEISVTVGATNKTNTVVSSEFYLKK